AGSFPLSAAFLHRSGAVATWAAALLSSYRRRGRTLYLRQRVAQLAGAAVQLLLPPLAHPRRAGFLGLLSVRRAEAHRGGDDACQLVCRRRNRLGRAQARALPPQIGAEVALAAHQAPRRQA